MPSSTFQFKQFTIQQDKCAMKVGTDAVLLGSWTECKNAKRILDIGTGSGIITLMLAQRSNAVIDALEIDKSSCEQAEENIKSSPWKDRINVIHSSLQNYLLKSEHQYDLIVSNPPYFIASSKAPDQKRSTARHTDTLPFNDLINGVTKLLTEDGRLCVILPLKEAQVLIDLAKESSLFLNKLTRISGRADKDSEKRWLMEFSKTSQEVKENKLAIEKGERHDYTEEYKELTNEFYLHF